MPLALMPQWSDHARLPHAAHRNAGLVSAFPEQQFVEPGSVDPLGPNFRSMRESSHANVAPLQCKPSGKLPRTCHPHQTEWGGTYIHNMKNVNSQTDVKSGHHESGSHSSPARRSLAALPSPLGSGCVTRKRTAGSNPTLSILPPQMSECS
jgi:hypothetical protein